MRNLCIRTTCGCCYIVQQKVTEVNTSNIIISMISCAWRFWPILFKFWLVEFYEYVRIILSLYLTRLSMTTIMAFYISKTLGVPCSLMKDLIHHIGVFYKTEFTDLDVFPEKHNTMKSHIIQRIKCYGQNNRGYWNAYIKNRIFLQKKTFPSSGNQCCSEYWKPPLLLSKNSSLLCSNLSIASPNPWYLPPPQQPPCLTTLAP